MSKRKLVLFDWDGTLSNVKKTLEHGLPLFSASMGLPHDVDQFSIGYFHPETVDMGWELPLAQQKDMRTQWDLFLTKNTLLDDTFLPPLYAGVPEMLAEISRLYDLGIVTARDRQPLIRMMKLHGIDTQIITYRTRDCATENGYCVKPAPDALLSILQETQHSQGDTVMIGDAPVDIEMANKAGVKNIAVLWGLYPQQSLEMTRPTRMAHKVEELPQLIEQVLSIG